MLLQPKSTQHIIRVSLLLAQRETICHLMPDCDAPSSGCRGVSPGDHRKGAGHGVPQPREGGMRVRPVTPGERPPGFQPTNSTAGPKPQPSLSKLGASDRSPEPHPRSPGRVGAAQTTQSSSPDSPSSPFLLRPRQAQPPAPPPPSSPAAPSHPRTCRPP